MFAKVLKSFSAQVRSSSRSEATRFLNLDNLERVDVLRNAVSEADETLTSYFTGQWYTYHAIPSSDRVPTASTDLKHGVQSNVYLIRSCCGGIMEIFRPLCLISVMFYRFRFSLSAYISMLRQNEILL